MKITLCDYCGKQIPLGGDPGPFFIRCDAGRVVAQVVPEKDICPDCKEAVSRAATEALLTRKKEAKV